MLAQQYAYLYICLGLLLGTEAPVMALTGVDFSVLFFFFYSCHGHQVLARHVTHLLI